MMKVFTNSIFRLVLMSTFMLVACGHNAIRTDNGNDNGDDSVYQTELTLLDQFYGTDPKQKYDIYLPAGRNMDKTPVLFMIHGGGWAAGDKSDYREQIKGFKALFPHLAFVSVGYRLANGKTGENQFPTQESDVKACIEYVLGKREEYKISEKIGTFGGSAGAHLAMLYAYKYGDVSHKPAAVISLTGPTNMEKLFEQVLLTDDPEKQTYHGWFIDAVGGMPDEKTELCKTSSPVNYVNADSSPTLMLYGADDTIVPFQQPDELDGKLTEFGVPHIYRLYPGEWHDLAGVGEKVLQEVTLFINMYLK